MKFEDLPERVLYFEPMPLLQAAPIRETCRRLGMELIMVSAARCGESLGYLAGYEGFGPRQEKRPVRPPRERVLIFCGVVAERLDQALAELKEAGAPPALHAVLTRTNAGWPLDRLVEELRKERDAIARHVRRRAERRGEA